MVAVVPPTVKSLPPIRRTLEKLLTRWRKGSDLRGQPWEVSAAASAIRDEMLADLEAYLAADIPPQTLAWTIRTPADRPGRFAAQLITEDAEPVTLNLVVGDVAPPEPKEDLGDGRGPVQIARPHCEDSPIRLARVVYQGQTTREDQAFWKPLADFGAPNWDAGWLLTYIAVYLVVMLVWRTVLRIP